MNYKRKNGENERQFIWRLSKEVFNGKITWQELADIVNVEFRTDESEYRCESSYRKPLQAARMYYDDVFSKMINGEYEEQLQQQKDEIRKERIKLSDQNRQKSAMLRDEARFEHLLSVLENSVKLLPEIKVAEYKPKTNNKRISAVAQFSDWHSLKLINNQWNEYNEDIMIQRANTVADKIIEKSKLHNVTDLYIEVNGDMIDGLIQVSARNVEEADVISQILSVSELLTQIINKLKPHYENMKIITTLGNHGRLGDKKLFSTKENFEMIIPEFLKLRLKETVPIIKSYGEDFVSYRINGNLIVVSHGQNDKLNTVISDFAKMYKEVPSEVHLGHLHSYRDINDCDIFVTVNGSLCGSDDYGIQCRKVNKPSQNFIVYDDDRCVYQLLAE